MITRCGECFLHFDDEFRFTYCPHNTFAANDGFNHFRHYTESYLERSNMSTKPVVITERPGITPFPGRILVQEDKPLEKVGRILIPEKHQTRPTMGVVISVGEGTKTAAKAGDRIVYPRWSGTGIAIKGRTNALRILTPEECLCFVDEGTEVDETGA